ncbi:cytochrome c oxidase subunit 3 family protein [Luteibacter sp. 329MFSha]|uniref:cytochrome c oxidase subunit 3 family protein n=1 Tax=Luteibacter sp. 329MFSha TaxID=1798239 RepID=UPI0008B43F15|nr:cytochrome c oxidase subunit 3 family protein [Luteibacter sp. 329MFSha]SEV84934.1 cytochrome c oxidase subunit 3 [Luteibacter sp. 329MFSha]
MNIRRARTAEPFDDVAQQREAATLGIWAFLATEILFFGVLFAAYAILRTLWPDAFASGSRHTDLLWGGVETGVLLVSSFSVALALRDVQLGGRRLAAWLLVLTAVLGLVFLGIHAAEYHADYKAAVIPGFRYEEVGGLAAQEQLFFVLYYVTTAFHGLHVAIGVVLLGVMAWRTRRGDFLPESHNALEVSALYWHLVDIVWVFVFPLYYLVGRA